MQDTGRQFLMSEQMQIAITDCMNCSSICLETINYCLQTGGKYAEAGHIRLLMDCAQISRTTSDFLLRMSELSGRLGAVSAEVADRCCSSLEHFRDDKQMRACYEACRRASDSCRRITGAML